MMDSSSNEDNAITIINDSNLQLSLPSPSPSLSQHRLLPSIIKIPISKDERLERLDIPKGLIELLQINGFTVERILEYGPSHIAEILGTDDHVAQIIFSETTKNSSDIISNYNF
jgi:hypothetical protein